MDIDRWKLVEDLLQSALELRADRREEFVRQACGDDTALRQDVESLLTSHRAAGSVSGTARNQRHRAGRSDQHIDRLRLWAIMN